MKMVISKKVEELIKDALENVVIPYENHDFTVDEVEHKHRDGFIPFTNGGFTLSATSDLGLAHDSGSYPTVIGEYIESSVKDARESYEGENYDTDDYYDHEHNWLAEGGAFWYEIRVLYYSKNNRRNISGQDEILVLAGVNTDFEYGRDKGLQISFERNIPRKEWRGIDWDNLIQAAADSIK